MDIGESIVGAYMRYIRECEVVIHNTFLSVGQGEIDVVALKTGPPREVWVCEVTTHIGGMLYPSGGGTVAKLRAKLDRAKAFADATFPDDRVHFEIWSPRVAKGKITDAFEEISAEFTGNGVDLHFVVNEDYTANMRELVDHAHNNSSATSEPAYRILQVLAHLRGGEFTV